MRNIYVEDGELFRKDNTIKLLKNGKLQWIPVKKIKEINCLGGCTITNEFLMLAMEHKISIHFYTYYGNYIGSFINKKINKNGKILSHQLDHFKENGVNLAREVVRTLLMNMLHYLDQYRKKKNEESKLTYKNISNNVSKLDKCDTIERIMGIEGLSWTYYYSFMTSLFQQYGFEGRNKRPPKDMINSLISFINTLIYNRIETQLSRTDIYTELSFLHSSQQKRNSLVLDIAELYKIDVTFRMIGYLVNRKMIKKYDFEIIDGMCVMKKETRKIVIAEFEERMRNFYYDHNLKRYVSLEHTIKLEGYKLIRSCLENKEYKPMRISGVKFE